MVIPLLAYNDDPINEDQEPSLKHPCINPPADRIRNLHTSNSPYQEAEKRRRITTNASHNPYVNNNTNEPINPYAFVTPAATATFDAATSLQGSVYNLFGIDTYEHLNDNTLPIFPPYDDDDYKDDRDADKDDDAHNTSNDCEQLVRAPNANKHLC